MDEFPGLLSRDFGFKPQGKSAPMAASRGTGNINSGGTLNFGIGSGGDTRSSSSFSSNRVNSSWNSNPIGGSSFLDNHEMLFGSSGNQKTKDHGVLGDDDDVFGGAPSTSSFDYDSMFQGSKNSGTKSSSLPVFDKPVYDDDIFDGVPGMKSSFPVDYDEMFSSISSFPKESAPYDDLLGNLGRNEPTSTSSSAKISGGVEKDVSGFNDLIPGNYDDMFSSFSSFPKESALNDDLLGNLGRNEPTWTSSSAKIPGEVEKGVSGFDDLIPGFGASSPPSNRVTSERSRTQQSTDTPTKSTSSVMEDPFVVLESTSTPSYASSEPFTEPLEQLDNPSKSGSTKVDVSSVRGGVFEDVDPLVGLSKSDMADPDTTNARNYAGKEPTEKPSMNMTENSSQKKVSVNNYPESDQTLFDMPAFSSYSHESLGQNGSHLPYVNVNPSETNSHVDLSPKSEDNLEAADDIWLTASEIPLFTQPTSAPPPSRSPPPRPVLVSTAVKGSSAVNSRKVKDFSSYQHFSQNFQSPKTVPDSVESSGVFSIDELEEFAMGRPRNNADEHGDFSSSEEELETNLASAASAAAVEEAMDRAEAKFKHTREVRERENAKASISRMDQQEKEEKAMQDALEQELRKKQERLDREREQRILEEKEREQRKLEKERERAQEIEREREREKARQAVERATKEARERAAAEARLKAERAAVEKANAEARKRAERAAVQRAQAEARERAAAEARERAERAAAEARDRAQAEAKEKAASVARAEAEGRLRAERAAVDRAAADARERAAANARERAAAAATRVNQQKNENDLESFFSMGGRPSSAPRSRTTSSDSPFDAHFHNRTRPDGTQWSSTGTSSSMRKASSTTNIVDDLSSIFGAAPSSGEFQEIEGESEERRRARLVRHQRTQERAAKALADKNERDLQTQREQAERHRIADTLDVEIKRWAVGKEGNLRALLSTLQYVLWPECGWQPVSLTDLITSASVKKVYRKATLCIHPDKVQQKGANLQQKYIAEKVFDILKEAWNKFNSEELF